MSHATRSPGSGAPSSGRKAPVLVCAADMPFVTAEVLRALVAAAGAPEPVAASRRPSGGSSRC